MNVIIRSMRNVLRNPLRLILVVLLLGVSLMFVAAMVSLNTSAQQQLQKVHQQVGTGITINYASNEAGGSSGTGSGNGQGSQGQGQGNGGFGGFGNTDNATPLPESVVGTVQKVDGVVSVEENLRRTDTDSTLKTSSFTTPDGQTRTISPTIYGISTNATHFTLGGGFGGGSAPTIVSGNPFDDSQANADVALMSQTLATNNNFKVGSTFTLKGTTFTIVGLYTTDTSTSTSGNTPRFSFADNTIILPLATMQKVYAVNGVDSLTAYASSYEMVATVADRLRTALGNQYDVTTQETFIQNAINAINVAQSSIQLALIVSIATAAIVIIFAVILLVRERTTEIGTLKAIGASHWQVIRQFWSEVLTLSLLAAILAAVLLALFGPTIADKFSPTTVTGFGGTGTGRGGFGGGAGGFGGGAGFGGGGGLFRNTLANTHLSAATLDLRSLLIILGLGIALAALTSVIPSWYVARLKPAEVLRKGN